MRTPRHAGFTPLRAGFTLIEVLVTLVILATGIVVVLQAFQTAATALGAARDTMRATHLMRQTFDIIAREGTGAVPPPGACPAPYDMFDRRVDVAPTDANIENLSMVTVEVWLRSAPATVYRQSTFRYDR